MAINRPNLPYIGVARQNYNYFKLLTRSDKSGVPDEALDGYFNFFTDQINNIITTMDGISLGDLPGVNDPTNANKLLTTNGAGTQSWVFVQASNILPNSITGDRLFDQTITANKLAIGAIGPNQLAPNAVTQIKILDFNITESKIANGAVTEGKIADDAVTELKIEDNAVTTNKILDANVTTDKILNANVTTAKIADSNITTAKILDSNVTTPKIADGAITLPKIAGGVLTAAASKAEQITAASATVYTNPAVQQHHPSSAKFICVFDGTLAGTNAPSFGYNVASVERISAALYKINFTVPFTSNIFSIGITSSYRASATASYLTGYYVSSTVNSVTITTRDIDLIVGESAYVSVQGFGLQ